MSTGQRDEKGEMKEERCSGADVCVNTVCPWCVLVWGVFFVFQFYSHPFFFTSPAPPATSFLFLLSGQEVA